jgi:hypothetical protein
MRENFRGTVLTWILMLAATLGWLAQKASTAPGAAPVPGLITSAKKIFIANMGADNFSQSVFKRLQDPTRPYNAFYAEMKSWNHYEIVDSPADAELIFEIGFSAPIVQEGQSAVTYGPEFNLAIVDAKTHVRLWTLAEPVDGAFRKATFEKNLNEGMRLLMEDLKKLSTPVAVRTDARAQ